MNSKNCALFCGGYSSEYHISVKSAQNIANNFPLEYNVYLVIVSKSNWIIKLDDASHEFDFKNPGFEKDGLQIRFDFAMIYVHGNPGENGKIQAYLDLFEIPYINSNVLVSSLSFDKWYCNNFLKGFGIPMAKNMCLQKDSLIDVEKIIKELGLPLFVKPTDSGSSFGISKVQHIDALLPAIEKARLEGELIMLESFLDGKEITCCVYQTIQGIQTLPLTEIVTQNDFFDYDAKYNGKSDEITPARINENQCNSIIELSKKIYVNLQLKSFARIDFMLVENSPYLIEINTIPGFSNESIVPKMLDCGQIKTENFLREIIQFELNR